MATNGTAAATGAPKDIGTVYAGGGPQYLGTDGQMHAAVGASPDGTLQPNPNFPPMYPSAGGGISAAAAPGSPGLVTSLLGAGKDVTIGVNLLILGALVAGVAFGAIAVPFAIVIGLSVLAADAGLWFFGSAVSRLEKWANGDPNEPGIDPITKLVRTLARATGLGGLMGDFIITATIGGLIYFISHRQGQTNIRIFRPAKARTNPPRRRRPMRRVGPAAQLRLKR
jgi:hypothetical protein